MDILELDNPGDKGREAEEILRGFLKDVFPQKWGISTGYAITDDDISSQIDIMIYDKDNYPKVYTGYLLEIVPIMALHLAIEVKIQLNTGNLVETNRKASHLKKIYFGDMYVQMAKKKIGPKQFYTSLFAFQSNCSLEPIQKSLLDQGIDGIDLLLVLNQGMLIKNNGSYAIILNKDEKWIGPTYDGFEVTSSHKIMVMYLTYIFNRMKTVKTIDTDYQMWQMHDSIHEDVFED